MPDLFSSYYWQNGKVRLRLPLPSDTLACNSEGIYFIKPSKYIQE